jgi:hypothetical protein
MEEREEKKKKYTGYEGAKWVKWKNAEWIVAAACCRHGRQPGISIEPIIITNLVLFLCSLFFFDVDWIS